MPLCYVYPAMLHYKACARTWKQKAADIALGVFGVIAAIYTTFQTIVVSAIHLLSRLCLTHSLKAHDTTEPTACTYRKLPYSRLLANFLGLGCFESIVDFRELYY